MKIKVLFDVSGVGHFPAGSEIDAALNSRSDMASAFDPNSVTWIFSAGQFAVLPEIPAAAAKASLAEVLGAKPARINIEF